MGKVFANISLLIDEYLTYGAYVKEIVSTITSKGQVTIPAEVRKHLGVKTHDKIAFVIVREGTVELKAPRYRSVASLRGAAGSLEKPFPWSETREMAREDRVKAKYGAQNE